MPFLFLLLAVPFAEIAMFILVGSEIGVAATLLLTLGTAVAGTLLLRHQGLSTIGRIRADVDSGCLPARPLAEGAMIAAAGLFLLTPGFITDALGLALFVPQVRAALWRQLEGRVTVRSFGAPMDPRRPGRVVDLDETEFAARPNRGSPWRDSLPDGRGD